MRCDRKCIDNEHGHCASTVYPDECCAPAFHALVTMQNNRQSPDAFWTVGPEETCGEPRKETKT